MLKLLWLIPILPLVGVVVNGLVGNRLPRRAVGAIACAVVLGSFLLSAGAAWELSKLPEDARWAETTALGAAYAAGLAVGFWVDLDELRSNWKADRQWDPMWGADQRDAAYRGWKKAVERSLDWA